MQVSLLVWLLPSLGGAPLGTSRRGKIHEFRGCSEDATGFSDSISSKATQASVSVTLYSDRWRAQSSPKALLSARFPSPTGPWGPSSQLG